MRTYFAFTGIILCTFLSICFLSFRSNDPDERLQIANEMEKSLQTELLNKWYPQSVDSQWGGFLSTFTYDFKPTGPQDKMIVTQARHTWTNAKASQLYPAVAYYKSSAQHGFHFLRDKMWDKEYGGFYTLVDRQGNVKGGANAPKEAYGNAFGIYALAAYYAASGDTAGLNFAKQAFLWLEQHSH
ncbi:MAG: AGE family epimerase/isomerase, partial [Flavisolibacter sp.]|nr:AGE family epimerase/isomerase [Flavisolibacter sp.]